MRNLTLASMFEPTHGDTLVFIYSDCLPVFDGNSQEVMKICPNLKHEEKL